MTSGTAPIGIDDIELATSHHVVKLDDFAEANGTDPAKFRLGLGQDEFSFPAPDEDVVTMAAAAAAKIASRERIHVAWQRSWPPPCSAVSCPCWPRRRTRVS